MIDWICNRWNHSLTAYNHNLLSLANLTLYADAVHQSRAALDNCWGFIDGTVRPGVNQRVLYNRTPPPALRAHMQGPLRGAALTQDEKDYNTAMNAARTAVEWVKLV